MPQRTKPVKQARDVIDPDDRGDNMIDMTEEWEGRGFEILWPGKAPDPNGEN
jgi:hypothetical protein